MARKTPYNKTKGEDVAFVKQHIVMFPVMELHYCRLNEDSTFMSATFDLESMLEEIPLGAESLLYYCRKLCIYKLCIYESRQPNETYCLLWYEINGKRGSNEIGTALMHWISKLPERILKKFPYFRIHAKVKIGINQYPHSCSFLQKLHNILM